MERILLLLLMLSNSSWASSDESASPGQAGSLSEACFQASRCTNSSHMQTFPAEDEYQCLLSCNADASCGWFTYFPEQGLCQQLNKCRQLSSCPTCLGGPRGCIVPHACIKGQCRGELIDSLPVSNFDECLALCKSTQGCQRITYNFSPNQLCLLSRNCSSVDDTYSRCVTCEPDGRPMGTGVVALILQRDSAEVYSPEGQCNSKLAKTPIKSGDAVLVFTNNRIIACDGGGCWEYNPGTDAWRKMSKFPLNGDNQPGIVLDNKLYVIDEYNTVHILDLTDNSWSTGPEPPASFGPGPSTVGWRDSIIMLGGVFNDQQVQIFNVTSQTWTIESTENHPGAIYKSSSTLLIDENQVLISGSRYQSSYHKAGIYNPKTYSWINLPRSQVNHEGSQLVKLGSRVFTIGGAQIDTVEEFLATSNTWSLIGINPINSYHGRHSIVAVPASLFTHLPRGCKGVL